MDFTSITTLDDLPRLDAALPQGAIAVSGGMLYSHFRAREFPSLLGVLWGVLMWAAGDLSMKDTAAALSAAGIEVSRSALRDRIAGSASWLQLLLSMLLCGNAAFPAKEDACVRVVVGDSTSLSSPGSKGTDFRVHALFDSATGALVGAQVTDAFVGESVSHHILGAESLGQDDRGFSNARNIHAKAARGARFLIRCNPGGIRICDTNGEVMRPADMEHLVRDDAPVDVEARFPARTSAAHGPRWHKHRTVRLAQARLIGVRTPKGVLWLLTNMPAGALPAKAAGELYRRRWQIELLFKTLKGVAGLDRLKCRGRDGEGVDMRQTHPRRARAKTRASLCDDRARRTLRAQRVLTLPCGLVRRHTRRPRSRDARADIGRTPSGTNAKHCAKTMPTGSRNAHPGWQPSERFFLLNLTPMG